MGQGSKKEKMSGKMNEKGVCKEFLKITPKRKIKQKLKEAANIRKRRRLMA